MRPISDTERTARLRLLQAKNLGPVLLKALAMDESGPEGRRLLSAAEVLDAGPDTWVKTFGMGPARIAALERARRAPISVRIPQGWTLLWLSDPAYPTPLRDTAAPPPFLWVFGDIEAVSMSSVAVVGTRRCSAYGHRMAYSIGFALARAGYGVVSGLAYGIDASAHRGALEGRGRTIAVMGCGPGQVYPPGHEALQNQIARKGALVSEFLPGEPPSRGNFPRRNRIISGLSHAVVVVEAYEKGGALITAATATDQNRDIYAVPGRADQEVARGSNMLLADGAGIVLSAVDLVQQLLEGPHQPATSNAKPASVPVARAPKRSPAECRILDVLKGGELTTEALAAKARILPRDLWLALVRLETTGMVDLLPGGRYALKGSALR